MANATVIIPSALNEHLPVWKSTLWSVRTSPYALSLLIAYPLICRFLRYRRKHQIEQEYYYGSGKEPNTATKPRPLNQMTEAEAYNILSTLADFEFPFSYEQGLQLALFRTYGIPSISKLLTKTTQLSAAKTVGKRYADTVALVAEMYGNAPNSERGIEAFARLNYLHAVYIKSGQISNDDMLYTLALFMNHPVERVNRYEWRRMSDVELCAAGLVHFSMGTAMDIDFSVLPSSSSGWRDGIHFYSELDTWAKAYEGKNMVPDQKNFDTAIKTKDYLLSTIPSFMHGPASKMVSGAMDERLRKAVMFEEPGLLPPMIVEAVLGVRKLLLRHLALPRPDFLSQKYIAIYKSSKDDRRHFTRYDTLPYYIKPTLWNRYGPSTWYRRLMGISLPGDAGMRPEGFLTKEVGPDMFMGKGRQEIEATRMKLRKTRLGGCPFAM